MLGSLRKFSSSIFAKILLGIIVIPFIFWGMGSTFKGGNKNVVATIDSDKYSIKEFVDYIQMYAPGYEKIGSNEIEEMLSAFISEKLIAKEVEYFGIKLSDFSLSKLIKHQKDFKRENKFSRVEYEKFLIKNNITASTFEKNLSNVEKRKQLLDFIGSGILPSKFLVNDAYDKINQKRNIQLIDLNEIFKKKFKFTEKEINSYYNNHIDDYKTIYKSVKILELNPEKLINSEEYNDLFFKKIDEIEDIIVQGERLDRIIEKFNLEKANIITIDKDGKDLNAKILNSLPKKLVKDIFIIEDTDPVSLIENKEKYFVVEVIKTQSVQKNISDESIRKKILSSLEYETKKNLASEIIVKINKKNFNKSDFDKLSKDENAAIKNIVIKNQNDDKVLLIELVKQIYRFPEKKVIVVHDINMSHNYLIYIDKIESASIDENSEEYKKYSILSKNIMANELYNTYDNYIKNKYEIDINYQALDTVKSYFIN
tara:strand:+ start:1218 stop:2669 length:1452 start_codon:yes stop_codon:yes gene_type:complete